MSLFRDQHLRLDLPQAVVNLRRRMARTPLIGERVSWDRAHPYLDRPCRRSKMGLFERSSLLN